MLFLKDNSACLKIHYENSQRCLSLPMKSDGVVPLHPELLLGFHEEKKIKGADSIQLGQNF